MKVFFDTSAIAKRYIDEIGTEIVIDICQKTTELYLCSICVPEFISVISRLKREGRITQSQFNNIKKTFLVEIVDATILQITPEIIINSVHLLEKYSLRTLDSLHISCGKLIKPDLFVSGDKRQLEAAMSEGLKIMSV